MGSYSDITAEIVGTFPRISFLHASQLVNRAWAKVRDLRLWSFSVVADAPITVPVAVTAGTVSATFGSTTIVPDATAAAAFNAITIPSLAGGIGIGRQIRITSASSLNAPQGPDYSIVSWDTVSDLEIDKPFGEGTITGSSYSVEKCYYAAPGFPYTSPSTPDPNLIRFLSIINRQSGYAFQGHNLNWSQELLNAIDPQRGATGDAYIQANYGRTPLGQPIFEFYPHPLTQTTYYATYLTRWPALSPTQDLPQMPYELADAVVAAAKVLAAQWALANVATFEDLGKTNWVAYMQAMQAEFKDAVIQAVKQDDEIMPGEVRRQGEGFLFPYIFGGAFVQSHDISSLLIR